MTTLQILEEARALVAKGWVGRCPRADGEQCIMSALASLVDFSIVRFIDSPECKAIAKAAGINPDSIVSFSDAGPKEKVVAAFDRAIEAERAKLPQTNIEVFQKMLTPHQAQTV